MEDIKLRCGIYRGKIKSTGEWVYFDPFELCFGSNFGLLDLDKNTICASTGLKDKNDRDIFYGDIVIYYSKAYTSEESLLIINYDYYCSDDFYHYFYDSEGPMLSTCKHDTDAYFHVVGNVFDMNDLLHKKD